MVSWFLGDLSYIFLTESVLAELLSPAVKCSLDFEDLHGRPAQDLLTSHLIQEYGVYPIRHFVPSSHSVAPCACVFFKDNATSLCSAPQTTSDGEMKLVHFHTADENNYNEILNFNFSED